MQINYKVIVPHKEGCRACALTKETGWRWWATPWSGIVKRQFFADRLCRRHQGNTLWTVISCNSIDCEAEIAINTNCVLKIANGDEGNINYRL